MTAFLPTLDNLGRDLLRITRWQLALSLMTPFLTATASLAFAISGWWVPAIACVVALSFATYGSISHDLVHRSYDLPPRLNDAFLTAIELLMLRSGRAYRLAHLNHHSRYPHLHDDPEAEAAHGTFWQAIRSGPFFFLRLWWWAVRRYPAHRTRLMAEGGVILVLVCAAVATALIGLSLVPLGYVALAYLGTWVVSLVTAYFPHTPAGSSPLSQTRRFRGSLARLLAFDHLYHLEHHLYPAVPHHHWRELANRLDPHLDRLRVPIVRISL